MKILYIASKYNYGNSQKGYTPEHYNFYDTLLKMDGGKHDIVYCPYDEVALKFGSKGMNRRLIEIAREIKPDLCFCLLNGEQIAKETLMKLSKEFLTFNWYPDDHWQFDTYSKYWASCFRWVGTTDSQTIKKYHKIGYKNIIHTQWACNHFLYKPLNLPKIYDVTFIGQAHKERKKIIEKIKKAGIDVKCWGSGWPTGRISQEEMIRIFSQSKINLNFTVGRVSLKSIGAIFFKKTKNKPIQIRSPFSWLDNFKAFPGKWRPQIKERIFEVVGCKGLLLTEDADNLRDYYEDGKEIVIGKDIDDFIDKIQYYLAYDNEREAIAQAGYKRTLCEHTFEKRFNEIFRIIGLVK